LSGDLSGAVLRLWIGMNDRRLVEPALLPTLGDSGNQTKPAYGHLRVPALGFLNRGGAPVELGKVARSARIRGEFGGQVLPMVLQPLREVA
jgi:hypothetical protein